MNCCRFPTSTPSSCAASSSSASHPACATVVLRWSLADAWQTTSQPGASGASTSKVASSSRPIPIPFAGPMSLSSERPASPSPSPSVTPRSLQIWSSRSSRPATGPATCWSEDTSESGTCGYPVRHLAEQVAGPVAGREDLDDQIWSERGVTDGLGLGEAGLSDESDIGPANGIGIGRELEATFDVDAPEAPGCDVVCQASAKLQRNTTVAQAGWLADDEDAAHELGVLVGNLQQFIRGQDCGRHAENVGGLAGHGKPVGARASTTRQRVAR